MTFLAQTTRPLKVMAICAFPHEAAATRFRLSQYVEPLRSEGIDLTIEPFLTSEQFADLYKRGGLAKKALGVARPLMKRLGQVMAISKFDVLMIQREAMPFGPGIFEWLYSKIGRHPVVLDLDDATYLPYMSPSYGWLGSYLKFFGKTDNLIKRSSIVTCGNTHIAAYVESKGALAAVVPTVVDTDQFKPAEPQNDVPVIGWIGTHSTFRVLEGFFPVFQHLAKRHKFKLKIVGSGRDFLEIPGVDIENQPWSLASEVEDFQSLDIGLYPVTVTESMTAEWIKAKSGFKAIQYFAVGIPFVMSPVGICAELGEPGKTHINATTHDEWIHALDVLLSDPDGRRTMGQAGRRHSIENYTLGETASKLGAVIRSVARQTS
jgi:glycosyltransferase involved in cell wall biosynthesis